MGGQQDLVKSGDSHGFGVIGHIKDGELPKPVRIRWLLPSVIFSHLIKTKTPAIPPLILEILNLTKEHHHLQVNLPIPQTNQTRLQKIKRLILLLTHLLNLIPQTTQEITPL